MERILIIGGNGCGKTTLAQTLASKLELPLIHLDMLYWRDNWESASKDLSPLAKSVYIPHHVDRVKLTSFVEYNGEY